MPGAATITQFQGQTPPWSLISLDANFTAMNALLKDVGNYSTYIADAGGANAYSCTYGASLTFSLSTGVAVKFKAANANTGASTLNVNATGIKNILNVDGSALVANQIVANGIYDAVYDGTQYLLMNPTQGRISGNSLVPGQLLVGDTTARSVNGSTSQLVQAGTATLAARRSAILYYAADASGPAIVLGKSRNAALGSFTYPSSGDTLGSVFFSGADEATPSFLQGAVVTGVAGSAWGAANRETYLSIQATGSGVTAPAEVARFIGAASATRYITFTNSNAGTQLIGTSAGPLAVTANPLLVNATVTSPSLSGASPVFQVDEGGGVAMGIHRNSADAFGANMIFRKTRSATAAGVTVVQSGDQLGQIFWGGTDGTNWIQAAAIQGVVDGVPGANDMPGRIGFFTTLDGASSVSERGRIINTGYWKMSNSGTFDSATSATHELDSDGTAITALVKNTNGAPLGQKILHSTDSNGVGNQFLQCIGNATTRAEIRSNGGFANFQANDVNLSDERMKSVIEVLRDVPGFMEGVWKAHRDLDWGRYKYSDQSHDEWNYGPSAQAVQQSFRGVAPDLVDLWQPHVTRDLKGELEIDGVAYRYALSERVENPDSPLAITGDFPSITGAVLSEAQRRIERLEAVLRAAKLL